ncbi:MAG: helix-turn-helix domain-containing protein [Acutalibacteraceae bacterium]|nr:helix-turn-helix domain-containing protein [Acutalibacteraceae bacterium]
MQGGFNIYDITKIKDYILFLKKECGLSVTLHTNGLDTLILQSELISFNIHDNPYCVYIKTCSEAQKHCISRQCKVEKKVESGSFEGVCYAGVREYVYPISNGEAVVGFICVSGYKTAAPQSYIKRISEKYPLSQKKLNAIYASLKADVPSKEKVDTLVKPLCDMLELAYIKTKSAAVVKEKFTDKVIRFLKQYHTQNISIEDICRNFNCSRSHISHQFCKATGKTVREYLTSLRMEDAKLLLLNSELTVTEIAFSVGYGDSNYFSNIFKQKVGMSPRDYRKRGK